MRRKSSACRRAGRTMIETEIATPPSNRNILESSIAKVDPKWRLMVQMAWAARKWRNLLDQRLRIIGQNGARMEALANIAYFPPESTQVELANRIGIERATITRMLDSLEADGLVERLADPADRRIKRIRLTSAGETALQDIQEIVIELRASLLSETDPAAVDQTNVFLARLLVQLDARLA
jgi:MarR family transcriptional regulator for hemolysin